ncbi:hypothetical protein RHMOL_Rhmol01G0084300 [Rhododendron molle]|uniref:Uncharacterized protein n=1 Tax=Rhododendron molle TaxID=49168 RepID=A0ACC0Q0S7_RHOML|nr:hypothetical protein RHMOL_Rhmol01G0084300 [Rhododendron molle]
MALVERTRTIRQSYQDWRLYRTYEEIYEINAGGQVIGMGPIFLEVFGAITRRLDDLHQRNSFCGKLLDTLNIRTEFQPIEPLEITERASPITTVWFPAQSQQCTEEILRGGILTDLVSVRYMVEDILRLYPLPAPQRLVVHPWTHLLNQPIYRPNWDMTLEQARRVALYNYSSPLFLGNTQLHHLIKRIYELIKENKVYFFNAVPLDWSTPEADMSDWKDRLPWDHRYAPNDPRQPRFCAIMYHPDSQVLQWDYNFGHGVSLYLREAYEHERDPEARREDRKWSETLSRELFEMFPDALPNIHYQMCNHLDLDEYCRFIFGCKVIEVLRHGPCGYNGGT